MAASGESSVPGRLLGRELRELRAGAGLTLHGAAGALECTARKLGRVENGVGAVRGHEVRAMCELYGAPPETTAALVGLAREVGAKGWWCAYGVTVSDEVDLYASVEAGACRLREYHGGLIPTLLQTRGYASALLAQPSAVPEGERERLVRARLARRSVLTRTYPAPPRFEAMLSEAVLRAERAGPAVMGEQLRHLLEASRLPNVVIRVVPFEAGPHFGAIAGPFVLLDFPAAGMRLTPEPPMVYRGSLTGALYLDRAEEIAAYEKVWASLDALALDAEQSRRLIAERSDGLHHAAAP